MQNNVLTRARVLLGAVSCVRVVRFNGTRGRSAARWRVCLSSTVGARRTMEDQVHSSAEDLRLCEGLSQEVTAATSVEGVERAFAAARAVLPAELLLQILQRLPSRDVLSCACAYPLWRDAVESEHAPPRLRPCPWAREVLCGRAAAAWAAADCTAGGSPCMVTALKTLDALWAPPSDAAVAAAAAALQAAARSEGCGEDAEADETVEAPFSALLESLSGGVLRPPAGGATPVEALRTAAGAALRLPLGFWCAHPESPFCSFCLTVPTS